jgi:hypothetical protein
MAVKPHPHPVRASKVCPNDLRQLSQHRVLLTNAATIVIFASDPEDAMRRARREDCHNCGGDIDTCSCSSCTDIKKQWAADLKKLINVEDLKALLNS